PARRERCAPGYQDGAVKRLSKAVQAGYASGRADREHMDRDADLNLIRDRADYKELIARIDQRLPPRTQTPATRVEALVREYKAASAGYRAALADAQTVAQKRRAQAQAPS